MPYKWQPKSKREGPMKKLGSILCPTAMFLFMAAPANPASMAAPSINPSDYPSLSEKELGHVQWLVKLAQQPPGDWSYMGGREEGQEGLEGYRYQLGYMTYALALAQYHKTPAYRELYREAIDNLIQKMVRKDVWSYWEHTSKGAKTTNPDLKERGLGWIDPVVRKNIMYSGHLINMLELYHMLYRDAKYDKPESITFRWQWVMQLLNIFHYDGNKLAKVIHEQFIESPVHMIECELNLVFPVCNQHPLLGLMLYDHNHGTDLSSAVKDLMMKTFRDKGLLDPKTQDFLQFYMLEQKRAVGPPSPGNNAFVGMCMHAWKPELIEALYRTHVNKIEWIADDVAGVAGDPTVGISSAPAFAAYAKEVGDEKTALGIISWMKKNCSPKWIGNKYLYPRNDELKISPLFNPIAAVAEINVKNGIWAMYNRPWEEDYFLQPFISSVEYPKAVVKQAYYDGNKDVLAVTILPGEKGAASTSFAVNQLSRSKIYSINRNGRLLGYLKKGAIESEKGVTELEFNDKGILRILTSLAEEQSFLIKAEN